MYPKLYTSTETNFEHNGLGILRDIVECYVEEEHNGLFELKLSYKVNGHLYDELEEGNIIKADASDRLRGQLFRIHKTLKKQSSVVEVFANHISYDLMNDVVKNIEIKNQSCEYALNQIFRQSDFCNHFKGYSDIQHSANYSMKHTNCMNAILGERGSIIDTFGNGAELLRDNFNIHVLQRRGKDDNVLIAYKKNITGIEIEEDKSDLITRIYPFAKISSDGGDEVTYTPSFGCVDSTRIRNYEHPYVKYLDFSDKFEEGETPTDAKFRTFCEKYFENNKCDIPKVNYKIQFIPLAMTENYKDRYKVLEEVGLMDTVFVRDTRFDIDTEAKVIRTKYNVIKEIYDEIELGNVKTSLNDIIIPDDGKDGVDGKPGATGPQGPQGPQGPMGPQGIPGVNGSNGITYYTWIRYAENQHGFNMTNIPNEYTTHIGIAYNQLTQEESNNPSDYQWTKIIGNQGIQGPQGEMGVPGVNGNDGITYYTWIRYALDDKGTGITDNPTGMSYIGISYNNLSPVESTNPKDYAWSKIKGDKGDQGVQGVPGLPGADGVTHFTWIRYADDAQGNGMSNLPTNKEYIGIAHNKTTQVESNNPSDYIWSKFKGDQGIPGVSGADGVTLYTWIKYSNYADGSAMSDDATNKKYIGIAYNKTEQQESTNPQDYQWTRLRGDQGLPGAVGADGRTYYTWIKYADDINGSNMSDSPDGKDYLGLAFNKETQTESNNAKDYNWSLIKGEQGIQGVPGVNGADGRTYFTWIKYASDAKGSNMSDYPDGRDYIGIAYNKETQTESTDYRDYSWSLIRGEQGIAGTNGVDGQTKFLWIKYSPNANGVPMQDSPDNMKYIGIAYNKDTATESTNPLDYAWSLIKGQDGTTFYTWIKFADDENGLNMSDDPQGKAFIGIAYNMESELESNNPSDYQWTKFVGNDGLPGRPGSDGVSLYTWIKFADDAQGTNMSDDPTDKAYMGMAYNKSEQKESNNPNDYVWVRIKGEDGADGEDGKDGEDGDLGDFPDTLPDVPQLTVNSMFATIGLTWTYENKMYYTYELYASQTKDFTPNTSNLLYRGQASAFLHEVSPSQTWYYRVRCVNSHGSSTAFSKQASGSTFKLTEDNIENYVENLAIGNALIKELNADKINAGKLKAMYLDTKELTVTDANGKRTLYIDTFGNVYLDVTQLSVNSSDVATKENLNSAIQESKEELSGKIDREINDMETSINHAMADLESALSDSILTESEKASIREHLNIIEREMKDIIAQVAAIKKASELKNTTELSNLNIKESEYIKAYEGFVARLNQAITRLSDKGE